MRHINRQTAAPSANRRCTTHTHTVAVAASHSGAGCSRRALMSMVAGGVAATAAAGLHVPHAAAAVSAARLAGLHARVAGLRPARLWSGMGARACMHAAGALRSALTAGCTRGAPRTLLLGDMGAPCGGTHCALPGRRAATSRGTAPSPRAHGVMPPHTAPPQPPLTQPPQELEYEVDKATGLTRVKYTPDGWRYWDWRGRQVHYIEAGANNTVRGVRGLDCRRDAAAGERRDPRRGAPPRPRAWLIWRALRGQPLSTARLSRLPPKTRPQGVPVVLVHGYGASAYHWRYQIPALEAAGHRVYAGARAPRGRGARAGPGRSPASGPAALHWSHRLDEARCALPPPPS